MTDSTNTITEIIDDVELKFLVFPESRPAPSGHPYTCDNCTSRRKVNDDRGEHIRCANGMDTLHPGGFPENNMACQYHSRVKQKRDAVTRNKIMNMGPDEFILDSLGHKFPEADKDGSGRIIFADLVDSAPETVRNVLLQKAGVYGLVRDHILDSETSDQKYAGKLGKVIAAAVKLAATIPAADNADANNASDPTNDVLTDDVGLARAVLAHNQKPFINVKKEGTKTVDTWTFTGTHYERDPMFTTMGIVIDAIRTLPLDADKKSELLGCKTITSFTNLVDRLATCKAEFDMDHSYLNGPNKVYDFEARTLTPNSPEHLTTMVTPYPIEVPGDDDDFWKAAPEFWTLLNHMFNVRNDGTPEDAENIACRDYFLFVVASSLLRKRQDEFIFIVHGQQANNGKTTLLLAIAKTLGMGRTGYACVLDSKTFSLRRTRNATNPELIQADNKCLAISDEPDKEEMDPSALKTTANMEVISMRNLFETTKEHGWTATVIHLCNNLPIMDLKDAGMMRRVVVVPIETHISESMKNAPRTYENGKREKYSTYLAMNEGTGILKILIHYLNGYLDAGGRLPTMPTNIREASDDYIRMYNPAKKFVDEACIDVRKLPVEARGYTKPDDLHKAFAKYFTDAQGQTFVMQKKNFIEALEALGYKVGPICDSRTDRHTIRAVDGLILKPPELPPKDSEKVSLQRRVLDVIKTRSPITAEAVADETKINAEDIHAILRVLELDGEIEMDEKKMIRTKFTRSVKSPQSKLRTT